MRLKVNANTHDLDIEEDVPLLWVLRDEHRITGPKYGCGIAMCGACTGHINGVARVTIITPRADAGHGAYSVQAVLVPEEMDLAWEDIRVDPGPPIGTDYNGKVLAEGPLHDGLLAREAETASPSFTARSAIANDNANAVAADRTKDHPFARPTDPITCLARTREVLARDRYLKPELRRSTAWDSGLERHAPLGPR
jgi:hypothetical protein